jgi:hypothetical protein
VRCAVAVAVAVLAVRRVGGRECGCARCSVSGANESRLSSIQFRVLPRKTLESESTQSEVDPGYNRGRGEYGIASYSKDVQVRIAAYALAELASPPRDTSEGPY